MKRQKTGGRKLGSRNKVGPATLTLKVAAAVYTAEMLDRLLRLARSPKTPPAVCLGAIKEILDRGHGKATQAHTGEGGGPVQVQTTVVHHHEG